MQLRSWNQLRSGLWAIAVLKQKRFTETHQNGGPDSRVTIFFARASRSKSGAHRSITRTFATTHRRYAVPAGSNQRSLSRSRTTSPTMINVGALT